MGGKRTIGVVTSARGLVPTGHLCWAYTDRAQFRARAAEYLLGGVDAGQWVEYVGSGTAAELRAELAALPGGREALASGQAVARPVSDFYVFASEDGAVDPLASVAKRVTAAERAIAAGYAGFRVIVDATAVASTPALRAAFAVFEHLIDTVMSSHPVTALCAYDAAVLGPTGVAEMACLHPFVNARTTPFQIWADDGVTFGLSGEVDMTGRDLLDETLSRVVPLAAGDTVLVDGERLDFIDHRGLLVFERVARAHGKAVVMRSGSALVARLIDLLGLDRVRAELVAR